MRLSHIKRFAALGSLGLLSACASLSANIDSDFSCRAPKGRCAPTSVIDAEALEANDGHQDGALRPAVTHIASSDSQMAARTGENILKIILPAHVDKSGYLRDEAAVYVVITKPRWAADQVRSVTERGAKEAAKRISRTNARSREAVADPEHAAASNLSAADFVTGEAAVGPAPETKANSIPDISSSREGSPLTLREAIAGASLPAIEGFATLSPARTPHAISVGDNAPSDFPNAAAIEAARRGHRIGDGSQGTTVAESETVPAVVSPMKSRPKSNAKRGRPARAANKVKRAQNTPVGPEAVTAPEVLASPAPEPRL